MTRHASEPELYEAEPVLGFAHPAVRGWFESRFGQPSPAQRAAWPPLSRGESVLLSSPTGSGKTLAAFLVAIDAILSRPKAEARTRVLYVSPLKALAVDVERNLEVPLLGIRELARAQGFELGPLRVGVRSGDTLPKVRTELVRKPPELLITTPESLYLMLMSRARETLHDIETVIIDEIHALCGTKRGAHLALCLERLERVRTVEQPLQRIGLSATQRPLDEVARFLGGFEVRAHQEAAPRPVTVLAVAGTRVLELSVELPLETAPSVSGSEASSGSAWPALHARLLELILAHRSTMVFVNNRRLAERLCNALNELYGEQIALAHHGSIAKERRQIAEASLKSGELRAVITTSSLELGIDVGAVDLVVQVEAPTSIASGIQRVGRAGHHVGGTSKGVFLPKFRGDVVATAAAVGHMLKGEVEETRYPRNPLDVLAQIIVAEVSQGEVRVDELYSLVCGAAPFVALPRAAFDGVLDMLSGRYPSERFRELRARLLWDRKQGLLYPRRGARLLAIANGGTIVDRGLYGVYVGGTEPMLRVGELDEEMVFESRVGEVFLLGASSWRIDEISHDRVLVSPAPGEPGKMPFWRGGAYGRSLAFGKAIGALLRRVAEHGPNSATFLQSEHKLDINAANGLIEHVLSQRAAEALPTDERIVVECFPDEGSSLRVVVLCPFGAKVMAPWVVAISDRLHREYGTEIDCMWSDDGMAFRLPDADKQPELAWFLPDSVSARRAVEASLPTTSLFASHFRENASRSLLLPRRRLGSRMPLWVQARRARDLLAVAREYPDFPVVLETFRECLADVFDLAGLCTVLDDIAAGTVHADWCSRETPSPFAAELLFSYVRNFIYDNDTPLAERRAQVLSLDPTQLRALLGEPSLRTLLDPDAIADVTLRLRTPGRLIAQEEDVADALWELGDSSLHELVRSAAVDTEGAQASVQSWVQSLLASGRVLQVEIAGEGRFILAEDAGLYRDALGLTIPDSAPEVFLEPRRDALADLILRFARTHGPFAVEQFLARYFRDDQRTNDVVVAVDAALRRHAEQGIVASGEFLPQGTGKEWCHADVLSRIRLASLRRARQSVEPVSTESYAAFLIAWHGLGADARHGSLQDALEPLYGVELSFVDLEESMLPLRVVGYHPRDLDELCGLGELFWIASGSERDPRVRLSPAPFEELLARAEPAPGELCERIRRLLRERGALFFSELQQELGGFEHDVLIALWQLVWASEVTNDTFAPLRALRRQEPPRSRPTAGIRGRMRRPRPPGTEGRWSVVAVQRKTPAHMALACVEQLLLRYGVVTREVMKRETLPGGFSTLYPVLRGMEDAGKVRRGYFVRGLSGAQFALPGATERLRASSKDDDALVLASTDPANAYGALLPWPGEEGRMARSPETSVVIHRGVLLAYVGKKRRAWQVFLADAEGPKAALLARAIEGWFERSEERAWLVETINGGPATDSALAPLFMTVGFRRSGKGLQKTRFGS